MLPNLIEATKEYWCKLDELEDAYKRGKLSVQEVDAEVASLMAELGQKRRAAFNYFFKGWQHWLVTQRETLVGLAILGIITYAWLSIKLSS
jgi:hypothetical protein